MGFAYIVKERMRQEELQSRAEKNGLGKFLLLLLFLIAYLILVAGEHGLSDGVAITAITWSFFVLCTPVADAGFLIDYPVRLLLNYRMLYMEAVVWTTAALINVYSLLANPGIYRANVLLELFNHILVTPYPFWGIIILSTAGTFLSINFGDEVFDSVSYSRERRLKPNLKHDFVVFLLIIAVVLFLYNLLLDELGIVLLHAI